MARKRRRGLSAEDRALWSKVTESITPRRLDAPAAPLEATAPPKQAEPLEIDLSPVTPPRVPAFRIGERTKPKSPGHDLVPTITERLAETPVRMDHKAFGRMKKGKLVPEARIDLHGMTQDQAHPALTRFIHDSYAKGLRLVLVITGKGKDRDEPGPLPVPRGVLKHQVPHWLSNGPMRLLVLQVTEAHLRHGGTGAYYIYLRRHR